MLVFALGLLLSAASFGEPRPAPPLADLTRIAWLAGNWR
jgi:hypothetical protein